MGKCDDIFFRQHEIKINRIVTRIYYCLCLIPIIVWILSYFKIYNYNMKLSFMGIIVSLLLAGTLSILNQFPTYYRIVKYFLAVSVQFIIFIYSVDVNIQMTVLYATVPLLTLLYFNPKLEIISCILATFSIILGTAIRTPQEVTILWRGVKPLTFFLSAGIGHLLEFVVASSIFISIAHISNKIMNQLNKKNNQVSGIQNKLVYSFADLIESRDGTTGEHVKRTSLTVQLITKYIKEHYSQLNYPVTEKELSLISMSAPLHDIGKMKIPDSILSKPGKLTFDEFDLIKTHTTEGAKLIEKTITNVEDPEYVKIAHDMALYHHEKWNGLGYPCGLKDEEIPVCARIMAVADVFDALCSRRSYKEAFSIDESYKIMIESKGSHFEPVLVDILVELRPELEKIYKAC